MTSLPKGPKKRLSCAERRPPGDLKNDRHTPDRRRRTQTRFGLQQCAYDFPASPETTPGSSRHSVPGKRKPKLIPCLRVVAPLIVLTREELLFAGKGSIEGFFSSDKYERHSFSDKRLSASGQYVRVRLSCNSVGTRMKCRSRACFVGLNSIPMIERCAIYRMV